MLPFMDVLVSSARSLLRSAQSAPAEVPGIRHPYYPRDLLLPGYEPLVLPYETILAAFFGAAAVLTACVWGASGKAWSLLLFCYHTMQLTSYLTFTDPLAGLSKRSTTADRLIMCWMAVSGVTHLVVEGAAVWTFLPLLGGTQSCDLSYTLLRGTP